MSIITDFLKLFKYDPETDGASTFNIKQCLNDNWDKIDAWASGIKTTIAGLVPGTRKINNMALSADVTLTGDDIKTSASDNTPIGDVVSVLSGATTPQGALANLGAGVRPNLLDNAIFIGGGSQQGGGQLPVNQRGQTSYTVSGYCIDRWQLRHGISLTLESGGMQITRGSTSSVEMIVDVLPNSLWEQIAGEIVTLSALVNGKLSSASFEAPVHLDQGIDSLDALVDNLRMDVYGTPNSNSCGVRFYSSASSTWTIQAVKLELGSTQTLAYQDEDGNWQLLPQPESDYATQLAKCQRYLAAMEEQTIVRSAYVSTNFVDFLVPIPVSFRVLPIIQSAEKLVLIIQPDGAKVSGVTWSIAAKSSASVQLRASKPNILSEGTDFSVYTDSGATFFSAEL